MCSKIGNIPVYFQNYNVSWSADDKIFILFRHGEKQKGDDPSLTNDGVRRAEKLSEILKGTKNLNIYSSDFKRTRETVQPLLDRTGEELFIYDARKIDDFSTQILSNSDGINIVSGHSNTTPELANKLCKCSAFPSIDETQYSNIYVVVLSDNVSKTYILNY